MKHSKKELKKKLKKIKFFKDHANEGLFDIFRKREKNAKNDNEKILRQIFNDYDIEIDNWERPGKLLPNENKNDEIISEYDGVNITFDTVKKTYELGIAPKYDNKFTFMVFDFIFQNYRIIEHNFNNFNAVWKVVKFQELSEDEKTELDANKYNL